MQIADNTVVSIHYTLKNDVGDILDSSQDNDPLTYLHGASNIITGLEDALTGHNIGDNVKATIAAKDAYGEKHDQLIQQIPRDAFPVEEVEIGMRFTAETEQGQQIVVVIGADDETVTIDGNHPLAGETLHFEVDVIEVRVATEEEASHGHVHGPHGHDH